MTLTDAFLRGAQFGRDVVYTYGPWGFLATPRGDPRIYPWVLGGRFLLAIAFVLAVTTIAARTIRRPVAQFLFLSFMCLLSEPISVLPILLLAVRRWKPASLVHLLAIACALTMWIKFTSFVAVGALAAALAVEDLARRRAPVISLNIATAALGFWLLAHQSLRTLPDYLSGAISLSRSYSAEMFRSATYYEPILVAALLLMIGIASTVLLVHRGSWKDWPSLAWIALTLFLQAKEAFVRADYAHIWLGILNAMLPCSLVIIHRGGFFDPGKILPSGIRELTRRCGAFATIVCLVISVVEFCGYGGQEQVQTTLINVNAIKSAIAGRPVDYNQQKEVFRASQPLADVGDGGTAAFFPDNQALIYGNNLRADLPPVPQAFAAYNADLSGRNASFYRSTSRPDHVFFDIAPIDNRYPSSSDTLSVRALMDCYWPSGYSGRYLILQARTCQEARLEVISETRTRIGNLIDVPSAGYAVWAQIDVRMNRAGALLALAARPPITEIVVDTGLGRSTFRISPEAGRMGFLLSPLILDPASFSDLWSEGKLDGKSVVRAFKIIQSDVGRRFFRPAFDVRLYRIRLPQRVGHSLAEGAE